MPSVYVEDLLRDLEKKVRDSLESGAKTEDIGRESKECKEAALNLPAGKEMRVAFYGYCLTKSLEGMTPDEILDGDGKATEVCRALSARLEDDPQKRADFEEHCILSKQKDPKKTVREIISEDDFFY
jgi:hypothetical protein